MKGSSLSITVRYRMHGEEGDLLLRYRIAQDTNQWIVWILLRICIHPTTRHNLVSTASLPHTHWHMGCKVIQNASTNVFLQYIVVQVILLIKYSMGIVFADNMVKLHYDSLCRIINPLFLHARITTPHDNCSFFRKRNPLPYPGNYQKGEKTTVSYSLPSAHRTVIVLFRRRFIGISQIIRREYVSPTITIPLYSLMRSVRLGEPHLRSVDRNQSVGCGGW